MKIKFNIQGMHCEGCVNLIKLTLEEHGFMDVEINRITGTGVAQTAALTFEEAEKDVNSAFSEMAKYSVTGIKKIT